MTLAASNRTVETIDSTPLVTRAVRWAASFMRRIAIGEIAGDQLALLYDKLGDFPLGLGRYFLF
jgi:hypothetical protein